MYEYRCELVSIYDGDTVTVDIDLGFDTWLRNQTVRIEGIDAPEIRTKDQEEKARAIQARDALAILLRAEKKLILRVEKYSASEKYGRILGTFVVGDFDVRHLLINQGLVRPYDGGKR